jgi:hypothetical protein
LKTPIVITAYNRLFTLKHTLDSLQECSDIQDRKIIFFVDGPKDDEDKMKVENVKINIDGWCKNKYQIFQWNHNVGININTMRLFEYMLNSYDRFIFIQDDMSFSIDFLQFMDMALEKYKDDDKIMMVSGFSNIEHNYCYIAPYGSAALGVWSNKWDNEIWNEDYKRISENKDIMREWAMQTTVAYPEMLANSVNGVSDSFMIKILYSLFKNKTYCLFPGMNKVRHNIVDSRNSRAKDMKILNQNLFEGWNPEIGDLFGAYNKLKKTTERKWYKNITRRLNPLR